MSTIQDRSRRRASTTPLEDALVRRAIEEHGKKPSPPLTFVYFIQPIEGGPIKIGTARSPVQRRMELQVGSPSRLRLTRVVVAHPDEEIRLHQVFHAVRLHGEWFAPHPELAALADAQSDADLAGVTLTVCGQTSRPEKLQAKKINAWRPGMAVVLNQKGTPIRDIALQLGVSQRQVNVWIGRSEAA